MAPRIYPGCPIFRNRWKNNAYQGDSCVNSAHRTRKQSFMNIAIESLIVWLRPEVKRESVTSKYGQRAIPAHEGKNQERSHSKSLALEAQKIDIVQQGGWPRTDRSPTRSDPEGSSRNEFGPGRGFSLPPHQATPRACASSISLREHWRGRHPTVVPQFSSAQG